MPRRRPSRERDRQRQLTGAPPIACSRHGATTRADRAPRRRPLPGGTISPGATRRSGCDGGTPIAAENRRFRRVAPGITGGAIPAARVLPWDVIGSVTAGRSGPTARPARCDSGCDRGSLSESHAGAAKSGARPSRWKPARGRLAGKRGQRSVTSLVVRPRARHRDTLPSPPPAAADTRTGPSGRRPPRPRKDAAAPRPFATTAFPFPRFLPQGWAETETETNTAPHRRRPGRNNPPEAPMGKPTTGTRV